MMRTRIWEKRHQITGSHIKIMVINVFRIFLRKRTCKYQMTVKLRKKILKWVRMIVRIQIKDSQTKISKIKQVVLFHPFNLILSNKNHPKLHWILLKIKETKLKIRLMYSIVMEIKIFRAIYKVLIRKNTKRILKILPSVMLQNPFKNAQSHPAMSFKALRV